MKEFMKMWICVLVVTTLVVVIGAAMVQVIAMLFAYSTLLGCIILFIMVTATLAMLLNGTI